MPDQPQKKPGPARVPAPVEELSEEDVKLQEELDNLVARVQSGDNKALDELASTIRTSTSSMTAVPKPLKYLRGHFEELEKVYHDRPTPELADVLSVIGTTVKAGDALKYRLEGDINSVDRWGHEYVRHLALEIGTAFRSRIEDETGTDELTQLALRIVPSLLKDNSEADAVDLLLEIESVDALEEFVDKQSYARVCQYIVACVPFLPPGDDVVCLHTAFGIYMNFDALPNALILAIRLDDATLVRNVFSAAKDDAMRLQLGFIVGQHGQTYDVDCPVAAEAMANTRLPEFYQYLIRELNLTEPKKTEDILRSQYDSTVTASALEPAKQNLATSFVNALVHTGYGHDQLILTDLDDQSWIYKTSGAGMQCTVASIGLLHMWDVNAGLPVLDRYLYSSEEHVKAGALLGVGVLTSGVHDEVDPAIALLSEYVDNPSITLRTSALMGLALAYAGTSREDLAELLTPLITNDELPMEVSSIAALALGLIFVGSSNGECVSSIMQALLERSASQLRDKWARFMALGLGLLFVGKIEDTEEISETIRAIDHPISEIVEILVTICSYCGSGNVLQIQKLLRECALRPYEDEADSEDESEEEEVDITQPDPSPGDANDAADEETNEEEDANDSQANNQTAQPEESPEDKEKRREARRESSKVKAYCVLGIAVIAMGEDIGQEMVMRHFSHLMHYGDAHIRRAVPLALGLISASNPEIKVYDTLSRYSHDSDLDVAINAVFAMGLVGAGTNNARLAQLLRQLAAYYSRDPDTLFMVRIAQGLLHLGKGLLSLSPIHYERQILSPVSLGGLLVVALALLNPKSFVLGQNPALMFFLSPVIHPRMLVTVDEELNPIKVTVRVGQAVDVVGQAGRPKTITGWVTHTTPVLLAVGERAELEDDEYIPLGAALEGIVILKKNPNFVEAQSS